MMYAPDYVRDPHGFTEYGGEVPGYAGLTDTQRVEKWLADTGRTHAGFIASLGIGTYDAATDSVAYGSHDDEFDDGVIVFAAVGAAFAAAIAAVAAAAGVGAGVEAAAIGAEVGESVSGIYAATPAELSAAASSYAPGAVIEVGESVSGGYAVTQAELDAAAASYGSRLTLPSGLDRLLKDAGASAPAQALKAAGSALATVARDLFNPAPGLVGPRPVTLGASGSSSGMVGGLLLALGLTVGAVALVKRKA